MGDDVTLKIKVEDSAGGSDSAAPAAPSAPPPVTRPQPPVPSPLPEARRDPIQQAARSQPNEASPQFNAVNQVNAPVEPESRRQRSESRAPVAPLSVVEEARKMRESEIRREQIKAVYENLYSSAEQTKGVFDITLDVAQKMRGTIGGTFGTLVGAALDLYAAFQAAKPQQKSSERIEAEKRNYIESLPQVIPAQAKDAASAVEPGRPEPAVQPESAVHQTATQPPVPTKPPAVEKPAPIQSQPIINEAREALIALGQTQKEADAMLSKVMATATRTFGSVEEVIAAAYKRPERAQETPAALPEKNAEQVERIGRPEIQKMLGEMGGDLGKVGDVIKEKLVKAFDDGSQIVMQHSGKEHPLTLDNSKIRDENQNQVGSVSPLSAHTEKQPAYFEIRHPPKKETAVRRETEVKPPVQSAADVGEMLFEHHEQEARATETIFPNAMQSNGQDFSPANIPTALHAPPEAGASAPIAKAAPQQASTAVSEAAPAAETAGGEAMAGMAAGAAAAVPIIGAVVVALQAVKAGAMAAVSGLGNLATMAADPDANPAKMVGNIGEGTKAVSDKLFWINPALGIFGSVVGEATSSLGKFMDAVNATATRYGEFSPQIAQAQAFAEIKQTMGDLRRAQEVGPELAKYLQVQSDLQQKFEDIKIKILVKILPLVTKLVESLETAMAAGTPIVEAIATLATPLAALVDVANQMLGVQRQDLVPDPLDPTELVLLSVAGQGNLQGQGIAAPNI